MVMTKAHAKRKQDIKSKLMAAVAMLLVSSIMMVSSTYAWFTLSTAPEVTGITTAVGANGNLEMALMPYSGDLTKIISSVGDSTANVAKRNVTWGNIVELGDPNVYGLNNIVLNPAKLKFATVEGGSAEDRTTINSTSILQAPAYGSDGRVSNLVDTLTGVYLGTGFYEDVPAADGQEAVENAKGVRAIGTSSGMSDRQMAFRGAVSAANTAMASAKRAASNSLNTHGQTLASIAVKKASNTSEFSYAEVNAIRSAITDLVGYDTITGEGETQKTVHTNGALDYIGEAMKYVAIAHAINNATDDGFKAIQTELEALDVDAIADHETYGDYVNSADLTTLNASIAAANTAKDGLDSALSGKGATDKIAWDAFSSALNAIVYVESSNMTVNGFAVKDLMISEGTGENKTYPNLNILISSAFTSGITMTLGSGSGVYADIADFAGEYSAGVTLSGITYGGMTAPDMPATMTADGVDPSKLSTAISGVGAFKGGANAAAASITDFYGYVVDLAFRTNVADSSLMLQTAAVDRIYSDGTNAATMGGGSSMTFKTNDVAFGANGVKSLMKHLKIVFFTPDMKIIGYAKLDPATATTEADGSVTMDIVMATAEGANAASAEIMELKQNEATALSMLVYLDGESVTNANVANATQSMMGSMNIQFSSSATLVPMEYTPLISGEETAFERDGMTPISVTGNAKGTAYYVKTGESRGIIYLPDASEEGKAVTIAGTAATQGTYAGRTGLGVTVPAKVTTAEINVEGNTQSGGSTPAAPVSYTKLATGATFDAATTYYMLDDGSYVQVEVTGETDFATKVAEGLYIKN